MRFQLFKLLSALPLRVLYGISDILYFLLAYIIRYRKQVVMGNLERAFPEKSPAERQAIAKGFYRNFADLLVETLKLPNLKGEDLKARMHFWNPELVLAKTQIGQPVIGMGSHQCNWEWAAGSSVLHGFPSDTVYKPLSNPFFEKLVFHIRSSFGVYPIPMKRLLKEMVLRRNKGRIIALIADQIPDQPEFGYWTEFMHQDTPFYPGTERLARSQKLPVYYIHIRRIRRGYYALTFYPIAEPPYDDLPEGEILNRYRDLLEKTIREAPSDWLWSHKRWKYQRDRYQKIQTKLE